MECSFEDAFFWALYYEGFNMRADAMYEYLRNPSNRQPNGTVNFPHGESACVTMDDVMHDRPNGILWMCLVQMFGDDDFGPSYGWIDHPDDACEWLRKRLRATYRCDENDDIRESVARWERRMAGDYSDDNELRAMGLVEK